MLDRNSDLYGPYRSGYRKALLDVKEFFSIDYELAKQIKSKKKFQMALMQVLALLLSDESALEAFFYGGGRHLWVKMDAKGNVVKITRDKNE